MDIIANNKTNSLLISKRSNNKNAIKNYIKKIILMLLICSFIIFSLSGCADYRGLGELAVVAGIAIDKSDEDPDMFHISFEVIDMLSAVSENGKISYMVEAEGISVFDAIMNANKRLSKELFFGNTELLVIDQKIAEENGIDVIIESFMRGFPLHDTLQVVISREKDAQSLIKPNENSNIIYSHEIIKNLQCQLITTSSVHALKIYEIYDYLRKGTECITLPAYKLYEKNEAPHPEIDGLAIFKKDKLKEFLEEDEKKYFSFTKERLRGGTIVFFMDDEKERRVTQTIVGTSPNIDISYENNKLNIVVGIDAQTQIKSFFPQKGEMDQDELRKIENKSSEELNENIKGLIKRMQDKGLDIFGFGTHVYRMKHGIWKEIRYDWGELFKEADIMVKSKFKIIDGGRIVRY